MKLTQSLTNFLLLLLLAAIWGGSFLFIRIAAPVMGSLTLMGVRMVLSTAAMWVYARAMRLDGNFRSRWKEYLCSGR